MIGSSMIGVADLEEKLRSVLPVACLVKQRHLHRYLLDQEEAGVRLPLLRDLPTWAKPADVINSDVSVRVPVDETATEWLLLIEPDDRNLLELPLEEQLAYYWQDLFRGRVRAELGKLPDVWHDLDQLLPEWTHADLRHLVISEHLVPPDPTKREILLAGIEYWCVVSAFEPEIIENVFPHWPTSWTTWVKQHLHCESWLQECRPAEATELVPIQFIPFMSREHSWNALDSEKGNARLKKANRTQKKGNLVRAAILFAQAVRFPLSKDDVILKNARLLLKQMVQQLPLSLDDAEQSEWQDALLPVLFQARQGYWSPAAKVLYDLQKMSKDLADSLSEIDPAHWLRNLGQQPIARPIEYGRNTILLRQLRRAEHHLMRVTNAANELDPLFSLLEKHIQQIEQQLRLELEPVIADIFADAGFQSIHTVETLAGAKIQAELIDVIVEKGVIRLADVRDAIARNEWKLNNLQGSREFFQGDLLLKLDVELGHRLVGVYRRGELYLRWIQRFSALAFGTGWGRWLSLYLALPFGVALLTVVFGQYVIDELDAIYNFIAGIVQTGDEELLNKEAPESETVSAEKKHGIHISAQGWMILGVLGLVNLGVLHSPAFRRGLILCLRSIGTLLRYVFWYWPWQIWNSPQFRLLRSSQPYRYLTRRLGWAFVIATGMALTLTFFGASQVRVLRWSLATWAVLASFQFSPFGRRFQDETEEVFYDLWRMIRVNLLPGLASWIVWLFREMIAWIDQFLYSVDEFLRYRGQQSQGSLWLKVILGIIWFPIAYVIRFAFYLLIEPQVNPIKHFPVVTVSHKLMLPLIPTIAKSLNLSFELVGGVISLIPGIFGFIVWELKENWRLYSANRALKLHPVTVGHHGESMRGMLRPGFHSGTIPNHYRRIRQLIARYRESRCIPAAKWQMHHHQIEHSLQAFLERDWLNPLRALPEWSATTFVAEHPEFGIQHVVWHIHMTGEVCQDLVATIYFCDGKLSVHISPIDNMTWSDKQRRSWAIVRDAFLVKAAVPETLDKSAMTWEEWKSFWEQSLPRHRDSLSSAPDHGTVALR